jgi:hypothetical protein
MARPETADHHLRGLYPVPCPPMICPNGPTFPTPPSPRIGVLETRQVMVPTDANRRFVRIRIDLH